jgi:hypothetical protein
MTVSSKNVSWQWAKANPDKAARKIRDLERETQQLREQLEQQAICNGAGASRELALRSTITELQREHAALRSAAVETCAIASVWVTVWGDKFSDASLLRFAELEEQILGRAKP